MITVGEVRSLLARAGVPHSDTTHYAIAAECRDTGPLVILNCCDDVTETLALLNAAEVSLSGGAQLSLSSPNIIVSREDLHRVMEALSLRGIGFRDEETENAYGRLITAHRGYRRGLSVMNRFGAPAYAPVMLATAVPGVPRRGEDDDD